MIMCSEFILFTSLGLKNFKNRFLAAISSYIFVCVHVFLGLFLTSLVQTPLNRVAATKSLSKCYNHPVRRFKNSRARETIHKNKCTHTLVLFHTINTEYIGSHFIFLQLRMIWMGQFWVGPHGGGGLLMIQKPSSFCFEM